MSKTATQASRFQWQLDWRTTLFTVVFVPLFIALGFWQLARAEQKQIISDRWELRRQLPPQSLDMLPTDPQQLAYRQVTMRGNFVPGRNFLLDNRINNGRYGVEVISVFELSESHQWVLVNRGWVAADPSRRTLPVVPSAVPTTGMDSMPGEELQLQGYVYVAPGESYTLGAISSDSNWPRLVQALDIAALAEMLDKPTFPFAVRLAQDSPAALLVDWPLLNARPEKHQAYAVQWFSMALVLALFFVWRSSNLAAALKLKH